MRTPDDNRKLKDLQSLYDQFYFDHYSSGVNVPYDRVEPWLSLFSGFAKQIDQQMNPKSVLDVGCAKGLLVEALRDRGVEAFGVDFSEYAIEQVREDIKPFCWVGTAWDVFPRKYDLIVCIEVLEHLSRSDGKLAIENFCRHSSDILFSSSPDDFAELTHLNVQPVEYWTELFAQQGFYRDVDFDASFIAEHAARYRKGTNSMSVILKGYDRKLWQFSQESRSQRLKNLELNQTIKTLESQIQESAEIVSQAKELEEALKKITILAEERLALLTHIQEGLGWHLLSSFKKAKGFMFPPETWRGSLYATLIKTIKIGVAEGVLPLLKKVSRKVFANLPLGRLSPETIEQIWHQKHSSLTTYSWGSRVLIVSGSSGDMERYRCHHTQEQLFLNGIPAKFLREADLNVFQCASEYDLVILHRIPMNESLQKAIHAFRANKALVLFDLDDLVCDPEKIDQIDAIRHLEKAEQVLFRNSVRGYRETLEACDGAIVSTESLSHAVQALGKSAWIHRNGLSLEILKISKKATENMKPENGKVVIGYASGTRSHNRDFHEVQGALQKILEKFPQTELRIIGYLDLDATWNKWRTRISHLNFVPWQELPHLLAEFDLNLAPLQMNNSFCESKSELKYLEAAVVGVPTVASRVGAYEWAIRNGENGLLAGNSDEWYQAIDRLICNPSIRKTLGKQAKEDVLRKYHPALLGLTLLDSFDEMAQKLRKNDHSPLPSSPSKAIIRFQEHELAHKFLDGLSGLEIGASSHNPFGLKTRNVVLSEGYDFYEAHQLVEMGVDPPIVHIWASGDQIPLPEQSEDFVLSSHVLEHMPNVIKAFIEWNRIVRNQGFVFMIVPLKWALAEDSTRELTPLSHFLNDFQENISLDTHSIEGVPGGKAGHYHTFTPDSVLEIVEWMKTNDLCQWELVAREDIDTKVGNGFTLVFKVSHS